jgi:hypothetical protein
MYKLLFPITWRVQHAAPPPLGPPLPQGSSFTGAATCVMGGRNLRLPRPPYITWRSVIGWRLL